MNIKTGVKAHDDACAVAESVRQVAVAAAGNNQASVKAAEISSMVSKAKRWKPQMTRAEAYRALAERLRAY